MRNFVSACCACVASTRQQRQFIVFEAGRTHQLASNVWLHYIAQLLGLIALVSRRPRFRIPMKPPPGWGGGGGGGGRGTPISKGRGCSSEILI